MSREVAGAIQGAVAPVTCTLRVKGGVAALGPIPPLKGIEICAAPADWALNSISCTGPPGIGGPAASSRNCTAREDTDGIP